MSDQIGRNRNTYLYQLYDASGVLLYAGITTNVKRRLAEHRPNRWYAEVARIETDLYPTRWRAALAEVATGHGKHGQLPGGISRGLAASMTKKELTEAASHPMYACLSDGVLARQWGIPVALVRKLRTDFVQRSIVEKHGATA